MSEAFSKEIVTSEGSASPRSNFRACSRTRAKKPLAPSVVTRTLAFLLIFDSPELVNLSLKSIGELVVSFEFYGLDFAHEVPVMVAMRIVVPENAAVVEAADSWIDIGQAVSNQLVAFEPNLLFQNSSTPKPCEIRRFVNALFSLGLLSLAVLFTIANRSRCNNRYPS